jgi:hypothetical protein
MNSILIRTIGLRGEGSFVILALVPDAARLAERIARFPACHRVRGTAGGRAAEAGADA